MTFRHLRPSFLGRWLESDTVLLTTGSPRISPRDLKKGWFSALKDVIRTSPSCPTRCHMIHSRLIYLQSAMYSDNHFAMYVGCGCYSANALLIDCPQKYSNCSFFTPIVESMMRNNPAERPTATEALEQWRSIRSRVQPLHRLWRLRERDESLISIVFFDIAYIFTSFTHTIRYFGRRIRRPSA